MTISLAQPVSPGIGDAATTAPSASRRLRRRFVRPRRAVVGLSILLSVAFTAIAAPVISPFAPDKLNPRDKLSEPFAAAKSGNYHILGTDQLGRDMLSRILHGGRVSLGTSLLAIFIAGA